MFLADLARRILLLFGLLIFLIPLVSLASSGGAPSVVVVAVLALITAARPSSGLAGLALVLPLAFALTGTSGFTVIQVTESFVLAFIVGALARSIRDGRLFMDSRLARPALALAAVVSVSGLCAVFEQSADAGVAIAGLWRAAQSYFVSRAAEDLLQPTLHWLEFAALVPLVELSVRRRPEWRHLTLIVWLGATGVAAVLTIPSPVHADAHAAGSLFAMLTVTAIVLAVTSRYRLAAAIVSVFLIAALWAAQAREPTGIGVNHAVTLRVELAKIALKMTAQAPVFGVGLGNFAWVSRDYVEPGVVASFPEVALGESPRNTFLQILAELGCVGLAAFVWLLWGAMRPMAVDPAARAARRALVVGLATFFLTALFGQPLLSYPIAAATFVTLGLAAGLLPARASSAGERVRWPEWILLAVLLVSLPWRISAALWPGSPEVVGAGPLQPELEGMPYRVADQLSRWRMPAHTRTVVAQMRWDPVGATDCRVRIRVRNRPPDEVGLRRDTWTPVRFAIPSGGRPGEPPEVEFNVSSSTCRLLVGTVTMTR